MARGGFAVISCWLPVVVVGIIQVLRRNVRAGATLMTYLGGNLSLRLLSPGVLILESPPRF